MLRTRSRYGVSERSELRALTSSSCLCDPDCSGFPTTVGRTCSSGDLRRGVSLAVKKSDISTVPIVPLYGHDRLRARLEAAVERQALPGSILIQGRRGIGKQRLALWLGQRLLCSAADARPCGRCVSCKYALDLVHPDLHWFFPRTRLADADATVEAIRSDYADALAERVAASGLYDPPTGSEGLFVATVRAVVRAASMTPTMSKRKVFIIGDAERMVPQEGAEAAANAFLKLLEEPLPDTTLILTSSEPGALLPTIRSRVVSFRATPLSDKEMDAFITHPFVKARLPEVDTDWDARRRMAGGSPGALIGGSGANEAMRAARALLSAATGTRDERLRAAFALGSSKARGFFSEMLDALTLLLHDREVEAARRDDPPRALAVGRAIDLVEDAKVRASGNVSPQLLGARLTRELSELLA